jgi:DHA1 family tetracycline resistance protein-like MFS transporter
MTESTETPTPRRAAFIFVFFTVVLDMLALGLIVPVLPKLIVRFADGDTAAGAKYYGLFATVWALMQFIFAPVLGALSDRFGRRPVILLSNLGLGLDYVLMALAPSLVWLFVGRTLSGITSASFATAGAYIADVTPIHQRASRFGMLGAAFGIGFVLGPALGGVLGSIDPRLPFWVAAALSLLNACYGLFVLPESLPAERRAPWQWRRASPIGSLRLLRSHPELLGLSSVSFLANVAHEVLPSVFVLYAGLRYGWDERTIGLTLAGVGICSSLVQGGLVSRTVRRFGERRTLIGGLLMGAIGFTLYGVAARGALLWLGVPFMALFGLAGPATQGLMTRHVSPTEQGQFQGAVSSLRGIARLVGPGLFTLTFAAFIGADRPFELPGAAFFLAALLLLCATVLASAVTRPRAQPQAASSGG